MTQTSDNINVEVEDIKPLTPHNDALYEAGKAMLIESISVSRDFSKFMISICTGAIPIHLGLLKFFLPEHYKLSLSQASFASIPCFFFLTASIIFMFGFYPQAGILSLDVIENIQTERQQTLKSRKIITLLATTLFVIGAILMIICELLFLTTIK